MGIIISPEKLIVKRAGIFRRQVFEKASDVAALRANLGGASGRGAGRRAALSPQQVPKTRAPGELG